MDHDLLSVYDSGFFIAWERFAGDISRAFYEATDDAITRPLATQQARYTVAIIRVAELLTAVGEKEIANRFYVLAEALNDLVEGIPHPLFKVETPTNKRGRKPDTSAIWRIRSNVCIAIEFMKAGGMTEDDAIAQVSKAHKAALVNLLRPNTEIKSSIKTWLKSFANDEVRNEVALSSYKHGVAPLSSLRLKFSGDQIRHVGEQLILDAAKWASSIVKI